MTNLTEPKWLTLARQYIGLKEIPGKKNNQTIVGWWKKIFSPWFTDDETPWCAAFVGAMLADAGLPNTKSAAALSYSKYGINVGGPKLGAIAYLARTNAKGQLVGGHVAFVVGKNAKNQILLLGGNQGDMVSIKAFDRSRILGYRWPLGYPIETPLLPVITADVGTTTKLV